MKKLFIFLTSCAVALTLVGFNACGGGEESSKTPSQSSEERKYSVSYSAGGGTGEAPAESSYAAGTVISLAVNPFVYEGYDFAGWLLGETLYAAEAEYTVPERDTVFTAKWEASQAPDPAPSFTRESYEYDRLGGAALELPLDLDGAQLFYVEVDGELLSSALYTYDDAKQALVIEDEFVLTLELGEHRVLAVTDAETEEDVVCTVKIMQSLKTTFDEETNKAFVYGKDAGVTYFVGYNGTTPVKLMQGEIEIDARYYEYDEDSFTVKAEWLSLNYKSTEYRLYLSNNDSYAFTVSTNVIFATDYDVTTIHNTTASNTGQNPLYQYYDNVSIVDGPEGMNGKVLKITPNTKEVTYDCNGYFTLRSSVWDSLWYKAPFTAGKYYSISFDYLTEGTSKGEFCVKSASSSWKKDLALGEANDGVVHRFSEVVSYEQIGNGISLWAKFIGGGGNVYIDNYKIAELDAVPSLSANGEYTLSGGYAMNFDSAGFVYSVLLDSETAEAVYDGKNGTLTFPASVMEALEAGSHEVKIITPVVTLSAEIRVVDNRVAEFSDTKVTYKALRKESVKACGSFTEGIELISLKQIVREYDDGYSGGWNFAQGDTETNFADRVLFKTGLDDTGYLQFPAAFLDCFWGETVFVAEFSNGAKREITVDCSDVLMFTNYDETTLFGYLNASAAPGSPLNSGMWNSEMAIEPRGDGGGNALFIRSTENAEDACAFSVRMHAHPWEWYTVQGTAGNAYRVTFEYRIENLAQDSVYFYIMSIGGENRDENFFGEYDALDYVAGDNYYKVRYNLIADGQTHVFDSGWFLYSSELRMMKIQLPKFAEADGAYVMLDDYRIVTARGISNPLNGLEDYSLGQSEPFGVDLNGQSILSLRVNGEEFEYAAEDGFLTLSKERLKELQPASYEIVLVTDVGRFVGNFLVSDDRAAALSETSKTVVRGEGNIKLAGEFDLSLKVVSLTRLGSNFWDSANEVPGQMNAAYVTILADGLELSQSLVDQAYGTTVYTVVFDNGKEVSFTLVSNILHYTDYDETYVHATLTGNSQVCQDSDMWQVVESDGNRKIKYTPESATQGHAVNAINGNGTDNFIFTFDNRNVGSYNWWDQYFASGDTIVIFFDYETALAGKTSHYQFTWIDKEQVHRSLPLSGKGTFYLELSADNLWGFGIHCPANSKGEVEGTCLYVDNFGFGYKMSKDYLTEYAKKVLYNGGEVTLAGSFPEGLTVTSLKRYGTNFWDDTKAAAGEINTSYAMLTVNGLVLSEALVNQVYGTETFWLALSDGKTLRFTLTSNLLHFTNYDETFVHEASTGNIRSCQDTSMWSVVEKNGGRRIEYRPENATLGHSTGALNGNGMDNGVFTFSNTSLGNHWWWEYEFKADDTILIFFDYEVMAGDKTPNYMFRYFDAKGTAHATPLSGSGTFKIEIAASDLAAFGIFCPASSPDEVAGTYMSIDNFGFGIKEK